LSETKESGAKYLGLLEAAPDAMVVVNQSGEIVLVNLQAEKQFGYSRDELLGQKVNSIVPEGFANAWSRTAFDPPKMPWHSRSAPESSSRRGARTAVSFPSKSC